MSATEESGKMKKVTKSYKGSVFMKMRFAAVFAAAVFTLSPSALAAPEPVVIINGTAVGSEAMAEIWNNTTYVSLRYVSESLDPSCIITWKNNTAFVQTNGMTLTARENDTYFSVNGTKITAPSGIKNVNGRILVPLRPLAQAFGATVYWNSVKKQASVISALNETYDKDELYWLSRIISAESRGEPLEGKIAVGNVVLNRVKSTQFPNTIYGVIFDERWGGQFEPVRNGTIYLEPTEESILAAKLCLSGANVIGDSIYFLAPALAQNFWIVENREYIATIGCHDFYR